MRRQHFTLDVVTGEGIDRPTAHIDCTGPIDRLITGLTDEGGDAIGGDRLDVACRLRGLEAAVVAVTNRQTGEYILEVDTDPETVRTLLSAAHGCDPDEGGCYRVEVTLDGDPFVAVEKGTFLLYDHGGDLLRGESLIPPGIEL